MLTRFLDDCQKSSRLERAFFILFVTVVYTLIAGKMAFSLFTPINKHFISEGRVVVALLCIGVLLGVLIEAWVERRLLILRTCA